MTTETQQTDLQQLTATVAALAAALAQSGRRHAQMARSLRWGALILVTLVGGATALFVGRLGAVYGPLVGSPPAADTVAPLSNINKSLAMFGMLSDGLARAVPSSRQAMLDHPQVRQDIADQVQAQGLPVTQDNLPADAGPALIQSVVATLIDTAVLLQHMREDANGLRERVGGRHRPCAGCNSHSR